MKRSIKTGIKKWDIIIMAILLAASFLPYICLREAGEKEAERVYAVITVDGRLYKKVYLTGQKSPIQYEIHTASGNNTVRIENERIGVIKSDCHDHICEEFGYISKPGKVIVCLPHKLYIELKADSSRDQSDTEDQTDVRNY